MILSEDYRRRARECLELAHASTDVYVQVSLTELAQEFDQAADEAERSSLRSEINRRASNRTSPRSVPPSRADYEPRGPLSTGARFAQG